MSRGQPGTAQRAGAVITVVGACVYLALKAIWALGGMVGVSTLGSVTSAEWRLVNLATGMLGFAAIGAAAALGSGWGMRLPAWLIVPPVWLATGMLAPVVVLLPTVAVLEAAGYPVDTSSPAAGPQLAGWVYAVVYSGFAAIGVGLGVTAFGYLRARWGHLIAGRLGDRAGRPLGAAGWIAAVTAGPVSLAYLGWALNLTLGRVEPPSQMERATDVTYGLLVLLAVTGVVLLARRRPRRIRVAWPAAAVWLGAGWMLSQVLAVPQFFTVDRWAPGGLRHDVYAALTVITVAAGVFAAVAALRARARVPSDPM
ncbi:MAG: hypothetical protein ACRDT8_07290 [Micromonosporaceae bacterium]